MIEIFGLSLSKIWLAIGATSVVKLLISPKGSIKQSLAGICSGALVAYYGAEFVIRNLSFFTEADIILVSIVLVLVGEHLVRSLLDSTPDKMISLLWKRVIK